MIAGRIAALRAEFDALGVDAYYIPKVDMFMGEYIRACDERLEWISGFTGSAGFAVITRDRAALFVDGRYTTQARTECPDFEIVLIPDNNLEDWLSGEAVGADATTMTQADFEKMSERLKIKFTYNPIDRLWADRPAPAPFEIRQLAPELAGQTTQEKIEGVVKELIKKGVEAFVTTNPESIAWLLNIRGGENDMVPAPHVCGTVNTIGEVTVFGMDKPEFDLPAKFEPLDVIKEKLNQFNGTIAVSKNALPVALFDMIKNPKAITDPIIAAKARKNSAEIKATQNAHETDAVAMCRFLHWLDDQDATTLNEIKIRDRLEDFRAEGQSYAGPSFDTISGFNQNGAIIHYRVSEKSNLKFTKHGLLLLDSGGQYPGATTDITRTIAIGDGIDVARAPYTAVLSGLANISQARFPKGYAGRDIDAFARSALWDQRLDYGHGTGHGVGAGLSVHEGPAGISKRSEVPLEAGMILSLEPGYYLEGQFGIRLENLAVVNERDDFMNFDTLTFVPFDRRLIDHNQLDSRAQYWLNGYHANVFNLISQHLDEPTKAWLEQNTLPL